MTQLRFLIKLARAGFIIRLKDSLLFFGPQAAMAQYAGRYNRHVDRIKVRTFSVQERVSASAARNGIRICGCDL